MNEKFGNVPFFKSVANCVNGTRFSFSLLLFATSEKYDNGLCFRAYG